MIHVWAVFWMLGIVLGLWAVDVRIILSLVLATIAVFLLHVSVGQHWALLEGIARAVALEFGYVIGLAVYAVSSRRRVQAKGIRRI